MVPSDDDDDEDYWHCDLEPDERRDLERLRRMESKLIAEGAIKWSHERDYDEEEQLERLRRMEEDLMAEMLAEAKRRRRPLGQKVSDWFDEHSEGALAVLVPVGCAAIWFIFALINWSLEAPPGMGFWEWLP